jgi:hypothetical protein
MEAILVQINTQLQNPQALLTTHLFAKAEIASILLISNWNAAAFAVPYSRTKESRFSWRRPTAITKRPFSTRLPAKARPIPAIPCQYLTLSGGGTKHLRPRPGWCSLGMYTRSSSDEKNLLIGKRHFVGSQCDEFCDHRESALGPD